MTTYTASTKVRKATKSQFGMLVLPLCTIFLLSLASTSALAQTVTYDYDLRGRLIQVTNPNASSTTYEYDNTGNLTAVKNPPLVASFSTSQSYAGLAITITGVNFTGATAVLFGTTSTTNFTVLSDTQISVIVPYTTTVGPITVQTPSGTTVSSTNFTVQQPTDYSVVTEDASLLVQKAFYQYYSGYPATVASPVGSPRNPANRYNPTPASRTNTVNCFTGAGACP
jgi:YD repeat-containing protein